MTRWDTVKRIHQAALEREIDQCAAFLDEVCAGDDVLRATWRRCSPTNWVRRRSWSRVPSRCSRRAPGSTGRFQSWAERSVTIKWKRCSAPGGMGEVTRGDAIEEGVRRAPEPDRALVAFSCGFDAGDDCVTAYISPVRQSLGEREFDRVSSEGRALSPAEAVRIAMSTT
jgi:hypothetical protein